MSQQFSQLLIYQAGKGKIQQAGEQNYLFFNIFMELFSFFICIYIIFSGFVNFSSQFPLLALPPLRGFHVCQFIAQPCTLVHHLTPCLPVLVQENSTFINVNPKIFCKLKMSVFPECYHYSHSEYIKYDLKFYSVINAACYLICILTGELVFFMTYFVQVYITYLLALAVKVYSICLFLGSLFITVFVKNTTVMQNKTV